MPEYLAPGVYVEEVSFRSKSIEGVSTSTTAFVGPTRKGPLSGTPEVITSFGEFSRIFGGRGDLTLDGSTAIPNYLALAVFGFFDNGGARLYVARTFIPRPDPDNAGETIDGVARSAAFVSDDGNSALFAARMPGSGLNGQVVATEKRTPATAVTMGAAPDGSLARVEGDPVILYRKVDDTWQDSDEPANTFDPTQSPFPTVHLVTMNVEAIDADGNSILYEDLGFDPAHPRYLGAVLAEEPTRRSDALQNPYYVNITGTVTAFQLHAGLFGSATTNSISLSDGDDGATPTATTTEDDAMAYSDALERLEDIDDISIIAAPGHSALSSFQAVQQSLISHAERMRYRVAVLDTPSGQTPGEARETRSHIDSTYAALYYPWIVISNPLARPGNELIPKEIAVPPSGHVAGIYARTDNLRGVWKSPANEVVRGALRFEREINHSQQEVLNPEGVNCLRYFFGRGNRVWGARTVSSDPEWKYLSVRRYMIFLEHSIDRSTQWVVFEPNGERLWANVRETISSFLYPQWLSGALLGSSPEEAYFVRCDRSTMTQDDLDNGRLICEIGVAVVKPAEFVIFRIGQKTADARA